MKPATPINSPAIPINTPDPAQHTADPTPAQHAAHTAPHSAPQQAPQDAPQPSQNPAESSLRAPIPSEKKSPDNHLRQKLFGSLSLRITLMFIALIGVVLAIVIGLISLTLKIYLTNEVDRSLISSGRILANETIDRIVNGSEEQVIPSDFYFYIRLPGVAPIEVKNSKATSRYGEPAQPNELMFYGVEHISEPFTAEGTSSDADWRVIVVPLQNAASHSQEAEGSILIALPLSSVDHTVDHIARIMVFLAITILFIGGLSSYVMAQRTLRSLRTIENVAHQVAAGDLTSRIPPIPPSTEVGELSCSINTMLAKIEHAFSMQQASEQKMRQFVSDASHELRTPLATVRGYAELYRLGGVPSSEVGHAFSRIESESARMGHLVEDLLKLARLDEGRNLSFTNVNITQIAKDAVADFLAKAPNREAHVCGLHEEEPENVVILADSDKVQQVISNLLANVLQHTPDTAAVEVLVGKDPQQPQEAIICVRDHGPGIKKSARQHIFERFYRIDASRSRDTGGTGLGLAIVAATLSAHGGTARVSETPGGGLTVHLRFPRVVSD